MFDGSSKVCGRSRKLNNRKCFFSFSNTILVAGIVVCMSIIKSFDGLHLKK